MGIVGQVVQVGLEEGIVHLIKSGQHWQQVPVCQCWLRSCPALLVVSHQVARFGQLRVQL